MEKQSIHPTSDLPVPNQAVPAAAKAPSMTKRLILALALFAPLALFHLASSSALASVHHKGHGLDLASEDACYQPSALTPKSSLLSELEKVHGTDAYLERAAEWLGGSVRVNTELYDLFGDVGEDPAWDKFEKFHEYLETSFPLVHKHLKKTRVNTYGLVYEWTGTDKDLKPFMLAGHQDTVPVERSTIDQWKQPPFSGKLVDGYVWGRGSCDDKSGTIGIMSTFETMLEQGFVPRRTVVFASGFDEEGSGPRGAGEIGPFLEQTYGKDGIAMIVDEGGGYADQFGVAMASPATGEKGQINLQIVVTTTGGHSSIPPDHTSIGYLSLLLAEVERHRHEAELTRENPFYAQLVCGAKYGSTIEKPMKHLIESSQTCDAKLRKLGNLLGEDRVQRAMVTTTQAIDLISGGVKVNALPERAVAVVNNRINVASNYEAVRDRLVDLLLPVAKEYNLALDGFGTLHETNKTSPAAGLVTLEYWSVRDPLNPAPITPTGKGVQPWELLAGTIKSSHATRKAAKKNEAEIIVGEAIMSGNTDTKHYWNLTKHIYRYAHISGADMYTPSGIHSVNEALKATAFVDVIRWYTRLILNADESDM